MHSDNSVHTNVLIQHLSCASYRSLSLYLTIVINVNVVKLVLLT